MSRINLPQSVIPLIDFGMLKSVSREYNMAVVVDLQDWCFSMLKGMVFYTITGTIVAVIAHAAGADMLMTLFLSLLVPPILLLVIAILRYKRIL